MILALTCIYNSDLIKLVHRFSSKVSISLTATRDVTFDYFSNSELRRVRDLSSASSQPKKSAPKNVIHLASSFLIMMLLEKADKKIWCIWKLIFIVLYMYLPTIPLP